VPAHSREALAAGVSIFELARLIGTSVKKIDRTYGHLAQDSEDAIRARLEARAGRTGVEQASESGGEYGPQISPRPASTGRLALLIARPQ
jgi:hypothetical protein